MPLAGPPTRRSGCTSGPYSDPAAPAAGSLPFYSTCPGLDVPVRFAFRMIERESSSGQLPEEVSALTKMNWNQTQLRTRQAPA